MEDDGPSDILDDLPILTFVIEIARIACFLSAPYLTFSTKLQLEQICDGGIGRMWTYPSMGSENESWTRCIVLDRGGLLL